RRCRLREVLVHDRVVVEEGTVDDHLLGVEQRAQVFRAGVATPPFVDGLVREREPFVEHVREQVLAYPLVVQALRDNADLLEVGAHDGGEFRWRVGFQILGHAPALAQPRSGYGASRNGGYASVTSVNAYAVTRLLQRRTPST